MLPVNHKRLDTKYSISSLRKANPLYNFGILDDLKYCKEYLKKQKAVGDPTNLSYEIPSNNSCAERQSDLSFLDSNTDCLVNYMKSKFGEELFNDKSYTCKGRVGIPSLPTPGHRNNANSQFQSVRGRLVTPAPRGTFGEGTVFEWVDANNSNADVAELCARRAGAKIQMKKDLPNWVFLYFRVRRVSWEFVVYEEKLNSSGIDLFSENILDKWTLKIRFKMLRDAPMKFPLMAFLARMGLDQDPDIVFCTDGFFGDILVGGLKNKNTMPYRQISFNTTPEALALQNGDNIFVVKANQTLRANVETHMQMLRTRMQNDGDDLDDEDEDDDRGDRSSGSLAESETNS